MTIHRSTAFIASIQNRRDGYKIAPITDQARMIIRLAVACHDAGTEYDLTWTIDPARAKVSITANGVIPMPRKLARPTERKVICEWKPKGWEAEYRLDAWHSTGKMNPGFCLDHSSGLSLVIPCGTGEWGTTEGDADPNGKWRVTHRLSGLSFGLPEFPLSKACQVIAFAASLPADWTKPANQITGLVRHGLTVQAEYGSVDQRSDARERLDKLPVELPIAA